MTMSSAGVVAMAKLGVFVIALVAWKAESVCRETGTTGRCVDAVSKVPISPVNKGQVRIRVIEVLYKTTSVDARRKNDLRRFLSIKNMLQLDFEMADVVN